MTDTCYPITKAKKITYYVIRCPNCGESEDWPDIPNGIITCDLCNIDFKVE